MRFNFIAPRGVLLAGTLFLLRVCAASADESPLAGTSLLDTSSDLSTQMVAGIDRFLMGEIDRSINERPKLWHRDFSSPTAYDQSVQINREHFRRCIGATDPRLAASAMEYVSTTAT